LRAHYKHTRGIEREWTVLGASRGEAGILGEGIRQAVRGQYGRESPQVHRGDVDLVWHLDHQTSWLAADTAGP